MKKLFGFIFALLALVGLASCGDDYVLSIAAPSGAPVLAVSTVIAENDDYEVQTDCAANVLQPLLVNGEKDIVIAPVNLGATVYNKVAQKYQLAAVITWGNLYFVSANADFSDINSLNGKDVYTFGAGTVNELVVNYVLEQCGVTINAENLKSTEETKLKLAADPNAIALVAEPAVSALKAKNSSLKTISVQQLYEEKSGKTGFPQAGIFVNVETVANHKGVVNDFLEDVEDEIEDISKNASDFSAAVAKLGNTTPAAVLESSIPGCNIRYVSASDAKEAIEFCIGLNASLFGGKTPDEGFYYSK